MAPQTTDEEEESENFQQFLEEMKAPHPWFSLSFQVCYFEVYVR